MNILIFGGTGFIGRPVVARLQGRGHRIRCLTRDVSRAKDLLGADIELLNLELPDSDFKKEIEFADVVINLAGEPLAGVRWNNSKKRKLNEIKSASQNR